MSVLEASNRGKMENHGEEQQTHSLRASRRIPVQLHVSSTQKDSIGTEFPALAYDLSYISSMLLVFRPSH